jgi:hypothetical protein
VEAIQTVLKDRTKYTEKVIDLINLDRPYDVVHFWKAGSDRSFGNHRTAVSLAIEDLAAAANHSLKTMTNCAGRRKKAGRQVAQEDYAAALLQYRIVVVCQRDHWEGHYRLSK